MSRKEYLDRLAYLLQDIPDSEREEALNYYTGYFEDAGEGEEANVIATLGSPEKVAALIKYDLNGADYEAGEYSESGYQDDRFREDNKVPELRKTYTQEGSGYQSGNGTNQYDKSYDRRTQKDRPERRSNRNIGWIILLCIFAIPVGIPILAGAFGLIVSVLAAAFAIVVTVAVLMVVFIVAGIVLIGSGIANLFVTPINGLLLGGVGMLMLALGILMVFACILVGGRLIPWLVRSIVSVCSRIFRRGGSVA